MKSKIIGFYQGKYRHPGTNKTIDEMWKWDDHHLESIHGYLTWWFPTKKQAISAEWDPITDEEIKQFKDDPELRKRYLKSFYRILAFYGFEIDSTFTPLRVKRAGNYEERTTMWVTPENHNYRRISRILQSLVLLGFANAASMLLQALMETYFENKKTIGLKTYEFWTLSVSDRQHWDGIK